MSSQMTRSFFLACFFAVSLEVSAQPAARVFAVVSLIGDNLDVVTHQPATGTVADRNVHDLIPVKDLAFDKFAILAVEDAVKLSQPGAQVKLFAPTAPELFREQERFFVDRKAALPADLLAGLQKAAATHLLMITKFRAPTQIAIVNQKFGSGTLEGIGFYVDEWKSLRRSDTRQTAKGFMAPYVYVKYSLVDLAAMAVIDAVPVTVSPAVSAARSEDGIDPWQALSAEQKSAALRRLITQATTRVVPMLMGKL